MMYLFSFKLSPSTHFPYFFFVQSENLILMMLVHISLNINLQMKNMSKHALGAYT